MTRTILGYAVISFAVLMWAGPLGLAIFDMVTWVAGFGPVTSVDWFDEDRRGTLFFWTLFGWLPMGPVVVAGLALGDF